MQHEAETTPNAPNPGAALHYSLLDEQLVRWRCVARGDIHHASLPMLFAAMASNEVRDFPALRPHQRHPWHAFLTQLGAIALHNAGQDSPWDSAGPWRAALLALTPDDPDGAAWCLVSPPARPALLQPPVPGGDVREWKNTIATADELDMLVTSRNHDLKGARMRRAEADDWLFALVSLQTQEGFLGAGNYGISRMNGGFASRPGVGVATRGPWGERWRSDLRTLLARREVIAEQFGLASGPGHALLWLPPWTGTDSLAMGSLDPLYIEVCRRVRLSLDSGHLVGRTTGSKAARVSAKGRNGVTGDAWTPIDTAEVKALTVPGSGFDYRLVAELLTGSKYSPGAAQELSGWPEGASLQLITQAIVRGQGKTEGYHERRVLISPKLHRLLRGPQRATVAQITKQRIEAIAALRKLLWSALALLFANGASGDSNDSIGDKAGRFARRFEQNEDARFFEDLNGEVEVDEEQRQEVRLRWLLELVHRAEQVLVDSFDAGPRSAMRRYKARAAAISRFHGGLRGPKPALPDLAHHYRQQAAVNSAAEDQNHV